MQCSTCSINYKRLAVTIAIVAPVNMFVLFGLFMNPISQQIIFSDAMGQSSKLVGVWTQIEPVPSLSSLAPALLIMPSIASIVFARFYDVLPTKDRRMKGLSFGIMLWSLVAVFFELFTPFGLFGEPPMLLAYELSLWFAGLTGVGTLMGIVYGHRQIEPPEMAEQLNDSVRHHDS